MINAFNFMIFSPCQLNEMPLTMQVKLLRAIQERCINCVGGETSIPVVHLICATNRDLKNRVDEGAFREDLWEKMKKLDIHADKAVED